MASIFIVRIRLTRQFVGIFVCDLEDLSSIVDECTDPDGCEYLEIDCAGGIHVPGQAPAVPSTPEEDGEIDFLAGAMPTGSWERYFMDDIYGWLPCRPETINRDDED